MRRCDRTWSSISANAAPSFRSSPGRRFVEQQQVRFVHQGATQLHHAGHAQARRSTGWSAKVARPTRSISSSARRSSSAVGLPRPSRSARTPGRRFAWAATRRCSRPCSPPRARAAWNVRPIPHRARACTPRRVTSSPRTRTTPRSGPMTTQEHVEQRRLAGAIGPDEPDRLALVDLQRTRRRAQPARRSAWRLAADRTAVTGPLRSRPPAPTPSSRPGRAAVRSSAGPPSCPPASPAALRAPRGTTRATAPSTWSSATSGCRAR